MRFLTLFLICAALQAQNPLSPPAAPATSAAQDPYDRLTPQSSVISFLEACRSKNYERAARYLNLEKLPREEQIQNGPHLAQQLGQVLDRDARFDVASLSHVSEGDQDDGLPPNRDRVGTYNAGGQTIELQLERTGRRTGLSAWVFAAESVEQIPKLAQIVSDSPVEKYLPVPLVAWTLADMALWRWIALAILAIFAILVSRLIAKLALLVAYPVCHRVAPRSKCVSFDSLASPLSVVFAALLFRAGMAFAAPNAIVRLYASRGLALAMIMGVAWLLCNIVELIFGHVRTVVSSGHNTFSRSALPLARRSVKAAIVIFAITAVLGAWGYNTNTIVAGLGIGGVAIALASQKTIENLFGGISVISDRPVAVGDLCKFGDQMGTVEDIGLRSTRVQTAGRTILTIPNSLFSSMVLENFATRDKLLFTPKFRLSHDSTPTEIRNIVAAILKILQAHPKVEAGKRAARFIGPGEYSFDVEVFSYILTTDYDEFLAIQQDLLLEIMDAIAAGGSSLAVSTQAGGK